MKSSSLIRRIVTWAFVVIALAVIGYRFVLPFTPPWIDVGFIGLSVVILVAVWADRKRKQRGKAENQ